MNQNDERFLVYHRTQRPVEARLYLHRAINERGQTGKPITERVCIPLEYLEMSAELLAHRELVRLIESSMPLLATMPIPTYSKLAGADLWPEIVFEDVLDAEIIG